MELHGLASAELNGAVGTLQAFHEERGARDTVIVSSSFFFWWVRDPLIMVNPTKSGNGQPLVLPGSLGHVGGS